MMDNDLSWLGLFKKGYKLQWRRTNWEYFIPWQDVNDELQKTHYEGVIFRYKHSSQ